MGYYPGSRTPRPPLDPEGTEQVSNIHAGWDKPFGPRWIGTALRRLAMRRRRKREDHGPPDELEHLTDNALAGDRNPPPPTPGGI